MGIRGSRVAPRALQQYHLVCSCWTEYQGRSCACGARVTYLLRGQEISNPKRRPPRLALAGPPARQVREAGPGFSTALRQPLLRCSDSGIHAVACAGENESTSGNCSCVASTRASMPSPVDSRCAARRPHLTAAQRPRVEQRAILARTLQRSRSRATVQVHGRRDERAFHPHPKRKARQNWF